MENYREISTREEILDLDWEIPGMEWDPESSTPQGDLAYDFCEYHKVLLRDEAEDLFFEACEDYYTEG